MMAKSHLSRRSLLGWLGLAPVAVVASQLPAVGGSAWEPAPSLPPAKLKTDTYTEDMTYSGNLHPGDIVVRDRGNWRHFRAEEDWGLQMGVFVENRTVITQGCADVRTNYVV
jgi:hypothetical protein